MLMYICLAIIIISLWLAWHSPDFGFAIIYLGIGFCLIVALFKLFG